jgi:hypothetical protein
LTVLIAGTPQLRSASLVAVELAFAQLSIVIDTSE